LPLFQYLNSPPGMAVTKGVFAGAALLALSEGRQFCLGNVATFAPWAADCN
jgi:hypothetical protein